MSGSLPYWLFFLFIKFEIIHPSSMKDELNKEIQKLMSGNLADTELEHQEELLLSELRRSDVPEDIAAIISALAKSGTPLAVPTLLGVAQNEGGNISALVRNTVAAIKKRTGQRHSFLPDAYFTIEHWQPQWRGSKNLFLSYISAIAHTLVKSGDVSAEIDRIGDILTTEMGMDISPCNTFREYRICATDWDFEKDYKMVLDRIAQEQAIAEVEELGIEESWNTFFTDHLLDLRYDYLLTRLRLGGDPDYQRFVLKIVECLNDNDN